MNNSDTMPWLANAWQTLQARMDSGRLAHAWLVTGESGVGKRAWADHAARMLVCGGSPAPCGRCRQCQLVDAESHPDVRVYSPENKSKIIKVNQIRDLVSFAVNSPQVSHRKVAIIDRADLLNISSANALLKTLEEPPEDLVLLLLQESGRPVLPTIRSRCQVLTLPVPDPGPSLLWLLQASSHIQGIDESQCRKALELSGQAPRLALEYLEADFIAGRDRALDHFRQFMKSQITVTEAARAFRELGPESSLRLFEIWAADLARLGAGGTPRDTDAADMLGYLASRNPAWKAHELLAEVQLARKALVYNVNPELEAERLLISWQTLMPRKSAGPSPARSQVAT